MTVVNTPASFSSASLSPSAAMSANPAAASPPLKEAALRRPPPATAMPEPQQPPQPPKRKRRYFPGPLTTKQWLYLIFPQTLGAAILDGGANFAIAYAMYHRQTLIEVWPIQHNTIAGDMAVTTFIQGILTFVIVSGMVHRDMRIGGIDPFPSPWPYAPSEKEPAQAGAERSSTPSPTRWRTAADAWFCGSDLHDIFSFSVGWGEWFHRLLRTVLEGALLSAVYFLLLWPIGIAIVAPIWDGRNMAGGWASECIKLVYGAVLGLIMSPVCAMIAMGSEDAVGRRWVRLLEEGEGGPRYSPPPAQQQAQGVVPAQPQQQEEQLAEQVKVIQPEREHVTPEQAGVEQLERAPEREQEGILPPPPPAESAPSEPPAQAQAQHPQPPEPAQE
ncbi:hypothetical protein CALVIDRAFT_536352 [Calocera viscosa TUFC12733]|uniref:Uncharacterized protein n=1 Tax=Calocera viscosa (strain TUFC12733) TaxID=1330018 RepID=A0A167N4E1_CALVF|nr:hypothetical protein CALVIDRAFT_536352 [Calocera viscosa TUFC12733]